MKKINILSQKEYDVYEFLADNYSEIHKDIKPAGKEFLERAHLFTGVFKIAFDRAFEEFILSSIKEHLAQHFKLTFEESECMLDINVIKIITGELFFDRSQYV